MVDFPEDFCPGIVQGPGKELQDMNSEEYENTSLVRHFGCFVLSDSTVVSIGAKFNDRDSPRDKTLHGKGAVIDLLPLIAG